MNIIYFTHYSGIYGANKSLLELASKMKSKYKVNPIIITPERGEFNKILNAEKIENYSYRFYYWRYLEGDSVLKRLYKYLRYKIFNRISLYKMIKKFKSSKISIVHTNSSCIDIGSIVANKLKVKHIWHIREFGEEDYNLVYYKGNEKSYKFIENKSDKIIFISNILKYKYDNYINERNKVKVIYNGISRDYFIDISNKDYANDFNIVFTGLICKEKNQIELIKSIEKLVKEKKMKNIKVYLLGDGEKEYISNLKDIVKQMNIQENILFEGKVNNVKEYIKKCHIGVIASTKEAFGRVTIEYMLGGVTVIASNTGANPEIINNYTNGLLYKLGDVDELTEKIELLYENRIMMKNIALEAQKNAIINFNSDLNCEKIYKLYSNALSD